MPRRSLLSDTERDSLLVLPESQNDLIQQYSFNDTDLALIRQRRGAANRLGFAVRACCATLDTRWPATPGCQIW